MPHSTEASSSSTPKKIPKKLVLCFDGTGNTFSGSTADTNVVKIYDKLDRDHDFQYHYYQTGIGTYDIGGGSLNKSFLGSITSSISSTLDSGFATTFDAHVMAGYRFIMRYYDQGDKIYMFGFSRGAFTARFLARMVHTVGLLSKGNEEMVPFAYQLYQNYESGRLKDEDSETQSATDAQSTASATPLNHCEDDTETDHEGHSHRDESQQIRRNAVNAFASTFCRREKADAKDAHGNDVYTGIKVYFLGLFDCVSSVKTLEGPIVKPAKPVTVLGTAEHVRHAVAIDERRVKFRAALLAQDVKKSAKSDEEDVKEVWFPGNHGDVGGGWPAPRPDPKYTRWEKFKYAITGSRPKPPPKDMREDNYQMSDVALHWMINEVKAVGKLNEDYALKWGTRCKDFEINFKNRKHEALKAGAHDTTAIGGGTSLIKVMFWKFMEYLPFLARWEYAVPVKKTGSATEEEPSGFYLERFIPNMRGTRDIPLGAIFHDSVRHRLLHNPKYRPGNNRGGRSKAVLTSSDELIENPDKKNFPSHEHHNTFILKADKDLAIRSNPAR